MPTRITNKCYDNWVRHWTICWTSEKAIGSIYSLRIEVMPPEIVWQVFNPQHAILNLWMRFVKPVVTKLLIYAFHAFVSECHNFSSYIVILHAFAFRLSCVKYVLQKRWTSVSHRFFRMRAWKINYQLCASVCAMYSKLFQQW